MARRRTGRRLSPAPRRGRAGARGACSSTTRPGTAPASMPRTTRVVVRLTDNRGFAGGANAGLARAFDDGAAHAVLLNDDVLVEPGCIEALVAAAGDRRRGVAAHRRPAGRRVRRRRARAASAASGGTSTARGDYLSGACLCISRSAWETVGPFDEELFLYYEDVDWCLRARALGVPLTVALEARAPRTAAAPRAAASRARRGRTTPRATGSGCSSGSAAPAHARREAMRTSAARPRPRAATGAPRRRARQACGRARLVRTTYGAGPVAPLKVAFDVACLTQTRAGTARLAIGLRDALRARDDVELIELGGAGVEGARLDRAEARRAAAGSRLVRPAARQGGARERARTCCTARRSAARCATRACRRSSPCTTSRCCASPRGSRPGAATTAAR